MQNPKCNKSATKRVKEPPFIPGSNRTFVFHFPAAYTVDYEAVFHLLSVDDEQTRRDIELYEATRKEMIMEAGRKAMMSLTPLQRRYIIRFYIDGAELKEIANETGTRQDTVWENLEAARRKFRKALDALEVA